MIMKIKTTQASLSIEGPVVPQEQLFWRGREKRLKEKWITEHQLFVCGDYVYTPVMIRGRLYHMQAITGTLYGNDGRAIDSNKEIDLSRMVSDDEKAIKILMMTPKEVSELMPDAPVFSVRGVE